MEDILDVYQLPYNPAFPVVCMDEKPYQFLNETREPIPMKRSHPRRSDYEYIREGMSSIFIFVEALRGRRTVTASKQRTAIDWAHQVKQMIESYPQAEKILLVMDNLNTHTIGSLYKAFPAQEARELAKKLELHYTPKHGSWLNIAEIELSVLERQCLLDRRIPNIELLQKELSAWNRERDTNQKGVDWQFTTSDARIKLKRLYPEIVSGNLT
jgi:hypothetical protein